MQIWKGLPRLWTMICISWNRRFHERAFLCEYNIIGVNITFFFKKMLQNHGFFVKVVFMFLLLVCFLCCSRAEEHLLIGKVIFFLTNVKSQKIFSK